MEIALPFILRDGSTAVVRVARKEDGEALRAFFKHLSPEARRRRFFSASLPSPELITALCDSSDPHAALTLIVTRTWEGESRIVATGSYLAKNERTAEVAFAVDDAFQGKGIGTRTYTGHEFGKKPSQTGDKSCLNLPGRIMKAHRPFVDYIANARAEFDAVFTPTGEFRDAYVPVIVTGVGFWDFYHGQRGRAANLVELHPVLDIQFP